MKNKNIDLSVIDIGLTVPEGTNLISSYSEEFISVNGEKFYNPIILSQDLLQNFHDFHQIIPLISDKSCPIIIYGSNCDKKKSDFKQFALSYLKGISYEIMSVNSACRTFNVLVQDGREIFAALEFKNI